MNILNIDDFAKTTRQINMGGIAYPVEEISVQQFIDKMKIAENLEKSETVQQVSTSFEAAVLAVSQSIPTMPVEMIRNFTLPAIAAVLAFIRDESKVESTPGADQEGTTEKKPD